MLKQMYDYHIGQTPLIELPKIGSNRIFLKQESKNYLGSIKARSAYGIVNRLDVSKDCVIVESTSGNLGVALDFFCREDGRAFLCLIDETVIEAKRKHLEECGVKYIVVPTGDGLDGRTSRIKYAEELMQSGKYYWVNQYDNDAGVNIHTQTTGKEIYDQTKGQVTRIICALGSGGTAVGVGEYFKANKPSVKVIGVEPYGSTIFHTHDAPYITAGAGMRGKPGNIKRHIDAISDSIVICDMLSVQKCRELNKIYNVDAGITTGMVYAAAEQYCETAENEVIVIVSADGMDMYNEYL